MRLSLHTSELGQKIQVSPSYMAAILDFKVTVEQNNLYNAINELSFTHNATNMYVRIT